MTVIRIPKKQWGKAWRAMIEIAPIRLIAADPLYEVLPAHLDLLKEMGVPFEVVPREPSKIKRRHATPD
jgi:hypothetical protein